MERLNGRRGFIRLQEILFVSITLVSTVASQPGFLSIDCGSDNDYNDSSTGISWVTDADYISTGINANNIEVKNSDTIGAFINKGQVGNLRYFDEPRSRDCYVLPVLSQNTHLIRATFYYGNWSNANNLNVSFNVSVNNNLVDWWAWTTGDESQYFTFYTEVIVYAFGSTFDFCLIRNEGPSFISALEVRRLGSGMYSAALGPTNMAYLYTLDRINKGPSELLYYDYLLRYPEDEYDRAWTLFGTGDNLPSIFNSNISSPSTFAQDPDRPPLAVMQSAWAYDDTLWMDYPFLGPVGNVYTAAYFQELDGNASATNVRGMVYFLNNELIQAFNSSNEPLEVHALKYLNETFINMSFVQANWSHLEPIINAYEIYAVLDFSTSLTAVEDVTALTALQLRLNLSSWTGDPCLPVPYGWLSCSTDDTPRITNLFLSNDGFGGNIPLEILNLTALVNLTLSDNKFNGSIPDLSSLVHLQSLYLQNNSLSGDIPSFLGTAFPNLTQLNLDNNNLSGQVPPDLSRPSLNFTVLDNPLIVNCTIPACFAPATTPPTQPSALAPTLATQSSAPAKSSSSRSSIGAVVGGILGGLAALAIIAGITWALCTRKRRARSNIVRAIELAENPASQVGEHGKNRKALAGSTTLLSLQEVNDATKKFSTKIGEGSFGPVYLGKLPNGKEVAVKVKSSESRQGFKEFLNEVELLSRIHHRNLVSLVGYCEEAEQQILVYVYVPNGTLRDHLYGDKSRKSLSWRIRLDIALNSAKGLEYLHTDCNPRIIHRDVKSSNILIDENMVAKVSDFGISKQAPEGIFTGVDTLLKGTLGYFDPEYFISQRLTQKSDVYSFGVVLLEIISGRHPHVSDFPDGTSGTLIEWFRNAGSVMDIVDPSLKGEFNPDSVMKSISLALSSVDMVTANRPDMTEVVHGIAEAIELELLSDVSPKTDHDSNESIPEGEAVGEDKHVSFLDNLPLSDGMSNPTDASNVEPQ